MSQTLYFNSQEAAKLLGVNVSTVKRWTDEQKLDCVRTKGGHRKFLVKHISAFLQNHADKLENATLFPVAGEQELNTAYHILKEDYGTLRELTYKYALEVRHDQVQNILNGLYMAQAPLHRIYDHLVTPVLYRIGEGWATNKLSIAEEHFASQVLRDGIVRLQGLIRLPAERVGKVLCVNLSNELHDIALKMIHHILEEKGFQVFYSGQRTPLFSVDDLLKMHSFDRIYVSSTVILEPEKEIADWKALLEKLKKLNSDIYVGGRGFDLLPHGNGDKAKRLYSMEDVYNT